MIPLLFSLCYNNLKINIAMILRRIIKYKDKVALKIKIIPPSMEGATLSACAAPDATFSPCMANCTSCCFVNGFPSKMLAANTPATELAALEPSLKTAMPATGRAVRADGEPAVAPATVTHVRSRADTPTTSVEACLRIARGDIRLRNSAFLDVCGVRRQRISNRARN